MLRALGISGESWLLKEYQGITRSFDCVPIVHQMIKHRSFPSFEKNGPTWLAILVSPMLTLSCTSYTFDLLIYFNYLKNKWVHLQKSLCLNSSRSKWGIWLIFSSWGLFCLLSEVGHIHAHLAPTCTSDLFILCQHRFWPLVTFRGVMVNIILFSFL